MGAYLTSRLVDRNWLENMQKYEVKKFKYTNKKQQSVDTSLGLFNN